ncbi:MAG: acetyl-CoA hydrolase/transferase family protein [Actinobacteria bacterium]|nr:acetyl-CoA hydrolase/transferase family protein [Actinomycetota bacterium]
MAAQQVALEEAVARLRPVDTLGVPLGPGIPGAFLHALGARDDWEDLTVFGALLVDLYAVFTHPGVRLLSGFYGPAERFLVDSGARVEFIPSDFRRFTRVAERLAPRVVASVATPPDRDGFVSLSLHAGATIQEAHRAGADPKRLLVIETNERLPWTHGLDPEHPHRLHVDEIDLLVESDRDLFVLPDDAPSDVDRAIAEHVRPFIHDGSTLQTGIGGIPSTIVKLLAEGEGGDYGVHSEMFTTGLMHLHRAGKVTNRRKGQYQGLSITTFSAGTLELYEWLDGNDDVRFLPVDVVNSPHVIAANHDMVTINGALALDLYGQAVADTIGDRQFSGIGGHEDFIAMSGLELEDRSLVCLPSSSVVEGVRISRILPALPEGWIVTTPRHQLDLVATEYGVAHLRGHTVRDRARALAEIAHPDFRDELRERAGALR